MPSLSLFNRALKLQIGGLVIDQTEGTSGGLRVIFSVERDKHSAPNNAQIQIYNLSGESRAKLEDDPELTCSLEAGYVDGLAQIFFGVVRSSLSTKSDDGLDWITTVGSGDGEKAYLEKEIHKTFALGTPIAAIVAEFATTLGLGTGNSSFAAAALFKGNLSPALKAPLTISGRVSDEFTDFLRSIGYTWSIQNGELTIDGALVPPGLGPLVSKATGLIGGVSKNADGKIAFKTLLLPDLVPGALVTLASDNVTGLFKAIKTKHYGDTYEDDWFTECEAEPL